MDRVLSVLRVGAFRQYSRLIMIAFILLAFGAASGTAGAAGAVFLPAGSTLPYSGQLSTASGQPVADGLYSFQFSLYAAQSGGEPLWTEVQPAVPVQAGAFTASLGAIQPLPAQGLGKTAWLGVSVRGPQEASFTALEPRQPLSTAALSAVSAPSQSAACAHDHVGDYWIGSDWDTIFIRNINDGTAVMGVEDTLAPSIYPAGVNGYSYHHYGVVGGTQDGTAIYGWSNQGVGVVSNGHTRDFSAEGSGVIYSVADTVLELNPQAMVQREDTAGNISVHPIYGGALRIDNDSGTGLRYVILPLQLPKTLLGSTIFAKELTVCYKAPGANFITTTALVKNDGTESGEEFPIIDTTDRTTDTRVCFSATATEPYSAINNVTWVQFNLNYSGAGAGNELYIYLVALTLSESAFAPVAAPAQPALQQVAP